MGCTSSAPKDDAPVGKPQQQKATSKPSAASAAAPAKKLDPKDFMLTRLKDQTIVREPGSIAGQQFIIEECDNCTIYLLDHSATVSIDECTNCRIFVGPCESSVFVRTSKHMKLVIAAQQLRTRECHDLDILLYVSAGQPVIEATSGVRLGCFNGFNYFGLAEQFTKAGLDPWYSEWSNVHDFTAGASGASASWSFIDPVTRGTDLLPALDTLDGRGLENLPSFVTPLTAGNRPAPFPNGVRYLVAIAPLAMHDLVGFDLLEQRLATMLASPQALVLVRTRRVDFARAPKDKLAGVFPKDRQAAFRGASVLGLELLCAPDRMAELQALLREASEAADATAQIFITADVAPRELFFENVAIM